MIDFVSFATKIDWATLIEDAVRAFQQQTPESYERLIMNAHNNMQTLIFTSLSGCPPPSMEVAPPTIGEQLGEDFFKELRESTSLEEKYHFTSEGSFVRD